jgi:hypothetical protein
MLDRRELADLRRDMRKTVQVPVLAAHRIGERVVLSGICAFQVERRDRWPR